MSKIEAGAVFTVPYPYSREEVELPPDDPEATCLVTVNSWRPGVRWVQVYDDSEAEAEGIGAMLLTVIDVHKPGRFPARVFFTRQWRDPDGKVFGKGGLRITTVPAFLRRTKGYMHDFELVVPQTPESQP
jgi:hypothetical protein